MGLLAVILTYLLIKDILEAKRIYIWPTLPGAGAHVAIADDTVLRLLRPPMLHCRSAKRPEPVPCPHLCLSGGLFVRYVREGMWLSVAVRAVARSCVWRLRPGCGLRFLC